jgi:hypothetical protein
MSKELFKALLNKDFLAQQLNRLSEELKTETRDWKVKELRARIKIVRGEYLRMSNLERKVG